MALPAGLPPAWFRLEDGCLMCSATAAVQIGQRGRIGLPKVLAHGHKRSKSVAANPFLGSTGHWPVPPGDSPGGTRSAPGGNRDGPFERSCLDLSVGESPTGTGESPVLPIFRTRSELPCEEIGGLEGSCPLNPPADNGALC